MMKGHRATAHSKCRIVGFKPIPKRKYVQKELKTSFGSILRRAGGGLVPRGI